MHLYLGAWTPELHDTRMRGSGSAIPWNLAILTIDVRIASEFLAAAAAGGKPEENAALLYRIRASGHGARPGAAGCMIGIQHASQAMVLPRGHGSFLGVLLSTAWPGRPAGRGYRSRIRKSIRDPMGSCTMGHRADQGAAQPVESGTWKREIDP